MRNRDMHYLVTLDDLLCTWSQVSQMPIEVKVTLIQYIELTILSLHRISPGMPWLHRRGTYRPPSYFEIWQQIPLLIFVSFEVEYGFQTSCFNCVNDNYNLVFINFYIAFNYISVFIRYSYENYFPQVSNNLHRYERHVEYSYNNFTWVRQISKQNHNRLIHHKMMKMKIHQMTIAQVRSHL